MIRVTEIRLEGEDKYVTLDVDGTPTHLREGDVIQPPRAAAAETSLIELHTLDGGAATIEVRRDPDGALLDVWWYGGGFNVELRGTPEAAERFADALRAAIT